MISDYTAHDFFRQEKLKLFAAPHRFITSSCLAYLSAFGLVKQKLLDSFELRTFLCNHPLLNYAYHHWGSHAQCCYRETGLPNIVFTLLAQWDQYPYGGLGCLDLFKPCHIAACYGLPDTLPATNGWCNQVTQIMLYTPLILACSKGHEAIVKLLLS